VKPWKRDLAYIREVGPDEPRFDEAVQRVWDRCEELEADAMAWDKATRNLANDLARAREALEFYAARHRYHSECCGTCINTDGGAMAREALS
jgi:hypothetical protein